MQPIEKVIIWLIGQGVDVVERQGVFCFYTEQGEFATIRANRHGIMILEIQGQAKYMSTGDIEFIKHLKTRSFRTEKNYS